MEVHYKFDVYYLTTTSENDRHYKVHKAGATAWKRGHSIKLNTVFIFDGWRNFGRKKTKFRCGNALGINFQFEISSRLLNFQKNSFCGMSKKSDFSHSARKLLTYFYMENCQKAIQLTIEGKYQHLYESNDNAIYASSLLPL